jgi:hypothetical protein
MKIILSEKQIKHLIKEHLLNEQTNTDSITPVSEIPQQTTALGIETAVFSGSTVQLLIGKDNKFYLVDKTNAKKVWNIPFNKISDVFKNPSVVDSANRALKKRGLAPQASKMISTQVANYEGATVQLYIGRDNKFYLVDKNNIKNVKAIPYDKIIQVFNKNVLLLADSELGIRGIKQPKEWFKKTETFTIKQPPATNQNNLKEQKWLGTWKKFLVKYYGFKGDDTTIGKKVYEFIVSNKKLYNKNKNLNKLNLLNGGVFEPVHESFMPPYYTTNETFPIYFYQKSNVIKNIQKKLGVRQTGYFLTLTENAIIKRLNFKKTQGNDVTYNRKTGVTKEIYDVIMSQDTTAPAINTPDYSQGLNTAINTPDYSQGLNTAINAQDYSQGLNTSGSQT